MPPGRIDIQVNVLVRVVGLQEQELGDHRIGDDIVNGRAEEDDAVLQEPGINIIGPLAAACLFNYHRDQ